MVGDPFKAGWKCSAEKKVIISVDRHLILILAEMKEGVEGSRIVVEGRNHELPREVERGDFPRQW